MISCTETLRQLWQYVERDLDTTDHQRVDDHLACCRRCRGEVAFATALRNILRSAARPTLPPEAHTRLVAFVNTLEQEPT